MSSGMAHKAQAEQRKADAEARQAKLREAKQDEEQLEARATAARQNQDVPRQLVLNGDTYTAQRTFRRSFARRVLAQAGVDGIKNGCTSC